MSNIIILCKKELKSLFVSPVAYCVITAFLFICTLFFFHFLSSYNVAINKLFNSNGFSFEAISVNTWVFEKYCTSIVSVFVFIIPLLTMRMFADERRQGTFEMLLTSPVSVFQIVMGKFLATSLIVLMMTLIIFILPMVLCFEMNPEIKPLLIGILGTFLVGVSFTSVAMMAACFSESQIVSGISGATLLLALYLIFLPAPSVGSSFEPILRYISPGSHANEFAQGVLSLQSGIYFACLTILGLFVTKRFLDTERWR